MNRHFQDTRYYLKRAGHTVKKGIAVELAPVTERVQKFTGNEPAPESGRFDELKADLETYAGNARGKASGAIEEGREKLESYRQTQA